MLLTFHTIGQWTLKQVRTAWCPTSLKLSFEETRRIDEHWDSARARQPDVQLFDGPMCRLERWEADERELLLYLSRTSYRVFLGTNMSGLADLPREALANPLGLSCALLSSDGFLLMGRRNDRVAYYPNRIHPFAGALEPDGANDLFGEVLRELDEELSLSATHLQEAVCLGMAEDRSLRQPELIWLARLHLSRAEIEGRLDRTEHEALVAMETSSPALLAAVKDVRAFTRIALATILLTGRYLYGESWFNEHAAALAGAGPAS